MSNPRKEDSIAGNVNDGVDRVDCDNVEEFGDSSRVDEASSNGVEVTGAREASTSEVNLTERLTDILVDEGDGDLLLQQSDREDRVIRWLQALDMQVLGACRADERLKPLLKMTTSNGMAEDRLLAQLSQHFEPVEVGILARCFCIPLVTVRVGKIDKRGTVLYPTTTRGNLNLMVLPSSDFRLSFVGDNGHVERLFTLSSRLSTAAITIDEIQSDDSGRSFVIKTNDEDIYFWCSEKSKLLGKELLIKMKDLLRRKPSISQLTGISELRLGCFATRLRAYLVESTVSNYQASSADSHSPVDTTRELSHPPHFAQSSSSLKSLRGRNSGSPAVKANSAHQGSLSPRLNSFKEGLPKTLFSLRDAAREKFRRRGDNIVLDNQTVASSVATDAMRVKSETLTVGGGGCLFSPSSVLESLGKLAVPTPASSSSHSPCLVSPLFTPYYCWCPSGTSILQQRDEPSQLPMSSISSSSNLSFSLPPLSSLLPVTTPSNLSLPASPLNIVDAPCVDFPALFPKPLVRFPLQTSQQIPTFTPLFCDPIVHVPVIDVCSSGQGYLVSAGPTISSSIPPLLPKLGNPMIPASDVEKDARETLRLLISSSNQANTPLMSVLPVVLTNAETNQSIFVTGSRGLYSGTQDIDAIADSIASISFVSFSGQSSVQNVEKRCDYDNSGDCHPDDRGDLESSRSDDGGSFPLSHYWERKSD